MSGAQSPAGGPFERGRTLFNAGRFFEAHEAWEELWREERGDARRRLQGLIQIAAALHKARAGAAGPCARLLAAGLDKLGPLGERGDLAAFGESVERSLAEARRWERGEAAGLSSMPVLPAPGA